jgi:hypothetical protein
VVKQLLKRPKLREKLDSLRLNINYILKFNLWFINGTEVQSGHRLGIIYGGDLQSRNFIISLAFADKYEVIELGKRGLYDIFLKSKRIRQNCCMMILKVNDILCKIIKRNRDFYIPLWVHGKIDVPLSLLKKSVKSDLKKITREKFSFEVTTEESKVKNFYNNMYLPYVNQRHGNMAIPTEYKYVKQYLKIGACDLMFVKRKSEYIAGLLILYEKSGPRLWLLGIKDGDQCYLKDHAGTACYYLASSYLQEQGYGSVNLGGSRAFLNDGVLQFKKKWGFRLVGKSEGGFLIKPVFGSTGFKGFFHRNPFIYMDQKRLCGAIFVENDQDCCSKSFEKLCKGLWLNGLSTLNIYRFSDVACADGMTVSPEILDKMTIRVADQPLKPAY